MNPVKLRRILILAHLYIAAALAPFFLMVGTTGALYVSDVKGANRETPITLPAGAILDPGSDNLDADVRALLASAGVAVRFEKLRVGDGSVRTWPIHRENVAFDLSGDALKATLLTPDLSRTLMELHKGHGPAVFRTYQTVAGVALGLVVLGGIAVGLLAASYRRATIIATLAGLGVFAALAFLA